MKKIWKSWRNGYFSKHEMFTWKWDLDQHFLLEKQFLWWIFCEVQKIQNFCGKKGISHPKKTKNDERLLFETSYNRNSENEFLERWNKWFFCQKKNQFILFERARLKKKGCETTKEIKQKHTYKKGWTNEKRKCFFFSKNNEKSNQCDFSKKKKTQQKKNKRRERQ